MYFFADLGQTFSYIRKTVNYRNMILNKPLPLVLLLWRAPGFGAAGIKPETTNTELFR